MKNSSHSDRPTLTCTEADSWLSMRVDGEGIPADIDEQVDSHLEACPQCRKRHEADRHRSAFLMGILRGEYPARDAPASDAAGFADVGDVARVANVSAMGDARPASALRSDKKLAAMITKALEAEGFDSLPAARPERSRKWAVLGACGPLLARAAAMVLIAFGAVYWVERALVDRGGQDAHGRRGSTNVLGASLGSEGGASGHFKLAEAEAVQVEVEEDFSSPRVVPDRDGHLWREGQRREVIWFDYPVADDAKRGPRIRVGMERVEPYYRPAGNIYR